MAQRIVQLNSLEEFCAETLHTPLVRLNLTESSRSNGSGVPLKDIQLDLMAVNTLDEIVWLHHSKSVLFTVDGPAPGRDAAIYAGMQTMYELVLAYLTGQGYRVRGGRYGIPADIKPLRGVFECVRWEKDGEESFRVVAMNDGD